MTSGLTMEMMMEMFRQHELKEKPWKENIKKNTKGKPDNCIENYLLYFNESDKYKGKLKYNEFLQQKEFDGKLWDDFTEDIAANDIEKELGLSNVTKVRTALSEIFMNNVYNPVQDYLKSLKWDGEERIEKLFIELLEADDTELNRLMSRKWFIAAVKRALHPGCKFDNILILKGAQGVGKSTICERLAKGFYSTISLDEISNKDVIDKMNKSWICIIDELDTFSKKEMTTVKTFLSTSIDTTRLAYGRYSKQYKRHCIFIGSTNENTFLRDYTSSIERRFWIIDCKKQKFDPQLNEILSSKYVDQLWAEAYYKLNDNPEQYLDIEAEHISEFGDKQKDFKKFNDDPAVSYAIEILEKEYVLHEGKFEDDIDFYNQFTNNKIYENNLLKSKIEKIPISSLLYVLKRVYGEVRTGNYLGNAIETCGKWKYSTMRVPNKNNPVMAMIRLGYKDGMYSSN